MSHTGPQGVAGLFLFGGLEVMRETDGLGLTAIPVVVAALLAYYAAAMKKTGLLD